jgi:MerR family regulatory protein
MDDGLTIQQVAQRTGLNIHTLRYYERLGLLISVIACLMDIGATTRATFNGLIS